VVYAAAAEYTTHPLRDGLIMCRSINQKIRVSEQAAW
jgi:hypothetical protein